jgi:hypothetical protein
VGDAAELLRGAGMARACDGCTACCFILGVDAVPKAPFSPCPHAIEGKGCGIYETRPPACAADGCLYMLDPRAPLADDDHPKKLGLAFFLRPQETLNRTTVFAYETRENAALEERAQAVIARLGRRLPVAVVQFGGTACLVRLPDDLRDRASEPGTSAVVSR